MKPYILSIAVLLLLQACGGKQETTEEAAPTPSNTVTLSAEQKKTAQIETGKVERRNMSSILKLNGVVDVPPQNMVSISVPLGGYLKSTKLLPGMHIAKGEAIAVLEDIQYIQLQQDYLTAKAQLAYTEADYKRQTELNKTKTTSDKVYEQASADYRSQKATVKALSEKLKLIGVDADNLSDESISRSITLRSPINGFVSAVNVNIGKYVNPADILFELVNPEDIHLSLTVFEKDLDKIAIGQKIEAYTNNNTSKRYKGEIILVGKDLSGSRSTEVHCHFDKYDNALIPGTYMNAEVAVQTTDARALPEDAVLDNGNDSYVFVAKGNDSYEMLKVEAGITDKGYRDIKSDRISDSTELVTKNAYTLYMKLRNTAE